MYFAAGLFVSTGLVGLVISLLTAPPRDYMLVRTTFLTRLDQRERPDEQGHCHASELRPLTDKLEVSHGEVRLPVLLQSASQEGGAAGCCDWRTGWIRVCNCILGMKEDQDLEKDQEKEMEEHIQKLSNLEQSTLQKVLLYSNLVIIVFLAIFLYVYMSISPFSEEDLDRFETVALDKTHLIVDNSLVA